MGENEEELALLEEMRDRRPRPWWKRYWSKAKRKCRELKRAPRNIRWFFHRAREGWAPKDWWSLDYYLSKVISESLKDYRENHYSYPLTRDDGRNQQRWEAELDHMIKAFEMARKVADGTWTYIPSDDWDQELYESMKETDEEYESDNYHPHTMTRKEARFMEEGMRKFMERYFHLWD